jgi:DNA primase large subunit
MMAFFVSDYVFACKYPFSQKAKMIMSESGMVFGKEEAEAGLERILSGLGKGIKGRTIIKESDGQKELASYAAARMIISNMRNRYVTNRMAVAESKRAFANLSGAPEAEVAAISGEVGVGAALAAGKDRMQIGVAQFLLFAPKDSHYRLVSRELESGRVGITRHEWVRLIEEAVKKTYERIPEPHGEPPEEVKACIAKISATLPKIEPRKISFGEGEVPPCINSILATLSRHENVGHTGRWLLAVYLINGGVSDEEIVKVFSSAPDFSEDITRYQVGHARNKRYMMPNCATVLAQGYCVAECGITNPLGWRKGMRPKMREAR